MGDSIEVEGCWQWVLWNADSFSGYFLAPILHATSPGLFGLILIRELRAKMKSITDYTYPFFPRKITWWCVLCQHYSWVAVNQVSRFLSWGHNKNKQEEKWGLGVAVTAAWSSTAWPVWRSVEFKEYRYTHVSMLGKRSRLWNAHRKLKYLRKGSYGKLFIVSVYHNWEYLLRCQRLYYSKSN